MGGFRKNAHRHFCKRVRERIGDSVDPQQLWDACRYGVDHLPNDLLEFVTRTSRTGRRLWRLNLKAGTFFLIYDHEIDCPITVLDPNATDRPFNRNTVKPQGKLTLDLREIQ